MDLRASAVSLDSDVQRGRRSSIIICEFCPGLFFFGAAFEGFPSPLGPLRGAFRGFLILRTANYLSPSQHCAISNVVSIFGKILLILKKNNFPHIMRTAMLFWDDS